MLAVEGAAAKHLVRTGTDLRVLYVVEGVLVRRVRVLEVVDHEVAVRQLLPRVAVLIVESHGLLQVLHGLLKRCCGGGGLTRLTKAEIEIIAKRM